MVENGFLCQTCCHCRRDIERRQSTATMLKEKGPESVDNVIAYVDRTVGKGELSSILTMLKPGGWFFIEVCLRRDLIDRVMLCV